VFSFIWLYCVPLLIFIVAYWKILTVVRRQAKLEADRRKVTVKAKEPVAGTSRGTTEMKMEGISNDKSERGLYKEGKPKDTAKGKEGQPRSTGLSQAKINVMKTMVYIVICFAVCWMPRASYFLYKKSTVTYRLSLNTCTV